MELQLIREGVQQVVIMERKELVGKRGGGGGGDLRTNICSSTEDGRGGRREELQQDRKRRGLVYYAHSVGSCCVLYCEWPKSQSSYPPRPRERHLPQLGLAIGCSTARRAEKLLHNRVFESSQLLRSTNPCHHIRLCTGPRPNKELSRRCARKPNRAPKHSSIMHAEAWWGVPR